MLEVEATEEGGGFCGCCGNQTRTVWGFVHGAEGTVASYFVQWTIGKPLQDHPVNFDLIYGRWGEGTSKENRSAISLLHFEDNGKPGVMVIDATERPVASSALVGSALTRSDVVGTPLAEQVFAIFDAVITQDRRLS